MNYCNTWYIYISAYYAIFRSYFQQSEIYISSSALVYFSDTLSSKYPYLIIMHHLELTSPESYKFTWECKILVNFSVEYYLVFSPPPPPQIKIGGYVPLSDFTIIGISICNTNRFRIVMIQIDRSTPSKSVISKNCLHYFIYFFK